MMTKKFLYPKNQIENEFEKKKYLKLKIYLIKILT